MTNRTNIATTNTAKSSDANRDRKTLIDRVDAVIDAASEGLSPTALADISVPECQLARKVAASARESLSAPTQALP